MGTSASLISHHRDRVTEDDTVGVNFLSLSLISAAGDNGELFLSCLLCVFFFLFFYSSYSYVSLCLYTIYMLWCLLYIQTFLTSVPTFFVWCAHLYIIMFVLSSLKKKRYIFVETVAIVWLLLNRIYSCFVV